MDKQILLHNLISDEMNRFDKLQHDFQKELKGLTRGSLLNRNGHPYRAYTENGRRYQVPVNDSKIVDELSLRRHIKAGLSSVQQRVKICKEFLKNCRTAVFVCRNVQAGCRHNGKKSDSF